MSDKRHILIVDDDPGIRVTVAEYFAENDFTVHSAQGGDEMRAAVAAHPVALVLLDLHLPGEDGFTLCRYLREHTHAGVVMLTGSQDAVNRVIGLEIGADDYVSKPFDLRELLARVRSVLRRLQPPAAAPAAAAQTIHNFGQCALNADTHTLRTARGEEVVLGAMELDLLLAFIENPNRVLTRDQLLNIAHNRDWDPYDRSIDVRVTRLRKKIEPDPSSPRHIKTIRGAGYLFSPDGG